MVKLGMGRDNKTLVFNLTIANCTHSVCLGISPGANSRPMDKTKSS